MAVIECVAAPAGLRRPPRRHQPRLLLPGADARGAQPARAPPGAALAAALDRAALHACAAALVGTHDFTAFTPTETDHVRFERDVFAAQWREIATDELEFWIEADAFMRHMNRVLVGTMLEVAGGRRSVAEFTALLEGRPRGAAGADGARPTACYLAGVGYDGHEPSCCGRARPQNIRSLDEVRLLMNRTLQMGRRRRAVSWNSHSGRSALPPQAADAA